MIKYQGVIIVGAFLMSAGICSWDLSRGYYGWAAFNALACFMDMTLLICMTITNASIAVRSHIS